MKQVLFAGILPLFLPSVCFSQVNTAYKFSITGGNLIAYKQGTSCTASSYTFYMITDAGVQAATPFYTLANTSREVNGIGINPVDRFLYGVEYDRDVNCIFSNFHLIRYDTHGNSEDLGTLPPVSGGSVTAALGCVTNNGNFVYSTKDASGYSYITVITDVASLPVNPAGTLTINTAKQIINNASNFSYADWAVHPANGKIYSYGIANISGVSTGKVLELDPATGLLQSTGLADGTDFLDVTRDNFGGVYFGNDGMLYGVNVNTRKLYKIDPFTGSVTYKSTMTGSGQIRADMGSYSTGWIVLPVSFEKLEWLTKGEQAFLHWHVAEGSEAKEFIVEQNTGNGFIEVKRLPVTDKLQNDFTVSVAPALSAQYRIKAVDAYAKVTYSPVVQFNPKNTALIKLLSNPVVNGQLSLTTSLSGNHGYAIISANGTTVQSGVLSCMPNSVHQMSLANLSRGVYLLQLSGATAVRFVVE